MTLTPDTSELCLQDHSQEQKYLPPKLQNDEEMLKQIVNNQSSGPGIWAGHPSSSSTRSNSLYFLGSYARRSFCIAYMD